MYKMLKTQAKLSTKRHPRPPWRTVVPETVALVYAATPHSGPFGKGVGLVKEFRSRRRDGGVQKSAARRGTGPAKAPEPTSGPSLDVSGRTASSVDTLL